MTSPRTTTVGLSEARLQHGSIGNFRQPILDAVSLRPIIAIPGIILLQSILISYVLFQSRRPDRRGGVCPYSAGGRAPDGGSVARLSLPFDAPRSLNPLRVLRMEAASFVATKSDWTCRSP